MYIYNMPLSFTMALAQQPRSAESFRNMTDDQKTEVVNKANTIRDKNLLPSKRLKTGKFILFNFF